MFEERRLNVQPQSSPWRGRSYRGNVPGYIGTHSTLSVTSHDNSNIPEYYLYIQFPQFRLPLVGVISEIFRSRQLFPCSGPHTSEDRSPLLCNNRSHRYDVHCYIE